LCPCLQLHSTTDMWNPHVMVIFNLENLYAQACGSGRRTSGTGRRALVAGHCPFRVASPMLTVGGTSCPLDGACRGQAPPPPSRPPGSRSRSRPHPVAGVCPTPRSAGRPFYCQALCRTGEARSCWTPPCAEEA
jgi:hypothetical protein